MKYNWQCFLDNTSTTEELVDFANGGPKTILYKYSWPIECKYYIRKIKNVKNARRSVRQFLRKQNLI